MVDRHDYVALEWVKGEIAHTLKQARAALVTGGELWIVGNRHLGYHAKLARLFRGVQQVAANPKFVVLKATK